MRLNRATGKALLAFRTRPHRITVYEGAVGSGKTTWSLVDWLDFVRHSPEGVDHLMTGRTERTVINNCVLVIQAWLGPDRVKINYGRGTFTINFGGGIVRTINIVGASNEQARTKIQGWNLYSAYVDEAALLPETYWNMLVSRLRVRGARGWATCNPEGPRHWLKVSWLDKATTWITGDGQTITDPEGDHRIARFTFLVDDNRDNLDPQYVEDLFNSYDEGSVFYRRFIMSEWAAAEGAIYREFTVARHVIPHAEIPANLATLGVGMDFATSGGKTGGRTRGYHGSIGDHARLGHRTLYVTAEFAPPPALSPAHQAARYVDWARNLPLTPNLFLDPAADAMEQSLRDAGVLSRHADNRVSRGIQTLSALLATDRILISDRCTELIKYLPGYTWDPKATERGEDKPLKVDDHEADALRYLVQSTRPWWEGAIPLTVGGDVAAAAA